MPMPQIWKLYDDQPNSNIDQVTFSKVVELLRETGAADRRDLTGDVLRTFKNKINYKYGDQPTNWIKVAVGRDTNGGPARIAIVYHLLKHRIDRDPLSAWSVTVGFDKDLLLDTEDWKGRYNPRREDPAYPNAKNPFLALSIAINTQIRVDISNFGPRGVRGHEFVVYDEIDRDETTTDPVGSDPLSKRRTTNIGELGWISQYANAADLRYTKFNIQTTKIRAPYGWGRRPPVVTTPDEFIVETVAWF